MSGILNNDLTQEEKIEKHKADIIKKNNKLYNRMKREHQTLFNMIWSDELLSPQEVLDSFGTDAVDLFTFSSKIQELLEQVDSSYVALVPPMPYVINEDGSVSVGE